MQEEQLNPPDEPLATRKNFRRNDKFCQEHPIKDPRVEDHGGSSLSIEFEELYPCDVYLGTDEPILTRKIISIANRHGFHIRAKAVHFVIGSWMNDFKSGDNDPKHGIWIGAICGHNPLCIMIRRDQDIKRHSRYAV